MTYCSLIYHGFNVFDRLKFTVVSEPPSTESLDESVNCEEVGIAFVNFVQMLKDGKDIIDEDIDSEFLG